VWQGKGLQSSVPHVWQANDFWAGFLYVRQAKDLRAATRTREFMTGENRSKTEEGNSPADV
jgi:hypothetical protein